MVMLGFTVDGARENIRGASKITTIREENPKREAAVRKSGRYDLYWKPRTKECELIGRYPLVSMQPFNFSNPEKLDRDEWCSENHGIAIDDGFDNAMDMLEWFWEWYGFSLIGKRFTIHRWDPYNPIEWEPRRVA